MIDWTDAQCSGMPDVMDGHSHHLALLIPMRLRSALYRTLTTRSAATVRRTLRIGDPLSSPGPVIVSGLFGEPSGVGRAADLTLEAIRQAGFDTRPAPLRSLLMREAGMLPESPGGVWILHCNPDEGARVLARTDPARWLGRRRVGFWAWELETTPSHWPEVAKLFHEIWVPSTFVEAALKRSGVRVPVRIMPHPVSLAAPPVRGARERWKLAERDFVVLTMGDLRSSATRKNLFGAIDIYCRAFPALGSATLLVKTTSPDPAFLSLARARAGNRPDVRFMTEVLAPTDLQILLASADVLLSPHRSEGFGLTLAEAMLNGTPALATGWSGNMDFMSALPNLQIDYSLKAVRDPTGIYRGSDTLWAEPDIEDAAIKMRRLVDDSGLRSSLAKQGADAVRRLSNAWTRDRLCQTALGAALRD